MPVLNTYNLLCFINIQVNTWYFIMHIYMYSYILTSTFIRPYRDWKWTAFHTMLFGTKRT